MAAPCVFAGSSASGNRNMTVQVLVLSRILQPFYNLQQYYSVRPEMNQISRLRVNRRADWPEHHFAFMLSGHPSIVYYCAHHEDW